VDHGFHAVAQIEPSMFEISRVEVIETLGAASRR
jgi:hypothetical protein